MRADEAIAALEAPTEDRRPLLRRLEAEVPAGTLAAALGSAGDPRTRELLADLLGRQASVDAGPALLHALGDPDPGVRSAAADAVGKVLLTHGPAAVPGAGEALSARWDDEPVGWARHTLAAALGAARHEPSRPALRAAAASDDRGLAHAATWALTQLDQEGMGPRGPAG